jgi:hypothetical protein
MVCYQGNCVSDKCVQNPCQNGGECALDNSDSGFHCNCPDGFTGIIHLFCYHSILIRNLKFDIILKDSIVKRQ